MKKKFTFAVSSLLLYFLLLPAMMLGQTADTVYVPNIDSQGNYVNILINTIQGDTTATGARNNPNRVYRLQRGNIYFLSGRSYITFPVSIIATDDSADVQPPVIAPYPAEDGSVSRITIQFSANVHLRNLYFCGFAPNNVRASQDRPVVIAGTNAVLRMENCIVDGFYSAGVYNTGSNTSAFISDCKFRNDNISSLFSGQFFFNGGLDMDTISIVNCTYFNCASYFFCTSSHYTNYARFEHNTLFLNKTNPFYVPNLSNAVIRNNILFCPAYAGETVNERSQGYYDWDNQREAVFSLDTLPTDLASSHNMTEAGRNVTFSNNQYYWPQEFLDYWAASDTIFAPMFMNDRTTAMFSDKTNYPGLVAENNINVDPGFNSNVMTQVDTSFIWMKAYRSGQSAPAYYYNPSGDIYFPGRWPLPEDLAYTNTTLQAAGTDGFALGDLNWFPAQKAKWLVTGIKEDKGSQIPNTFSLSNAYPNPFNPTTNIKFSIAKSENINLVVFNVLGQKVKTLVNGAMKAGSYTATWDGRDDFGSHVASGIYFYRLESQSFNVTKKMILMK
jgi:hypothetical protein